MRTRRRSFPKGTQAGQTIQPHRLVTICPILSQVHCAPQDLQPTRHQAVQHELDSRMKFHLAVSWLLQQKKSSSVIHNQSDANTSLTKDVPQVDIVFVGAPQWSHSRPAMRVAVNPTKGTAHRRQVAQSSLAVSPVHSAAPA